MPISLPSKPNRVVPNPVYTAPRPKMDATSREPAEHDMDVREYLRKQAEDQHRHYREITAGSVDKRDELTIVSNGPGVEVKAAHGMKFRPTRFQKIMGRGRVDNSRDTLADDQFIYVETTGAAGAQYVVMLWSHEAGNG